MPKRQNAAKGSGYKKNPTNQPKTGRAHDRATERRRRLARAKDQRGCDEAAGRFWHTMSLYWPAAMLMGGVLTGVSLLSRRVWTT